MKLNMLYNKTIFSDNKGNELRLSNVNHIEKQVLFQNFSAKYVVAGNENYKINNRKIKVNEGEYVIGNKNCLSSVVIDNSIPTKGICIDISKEIITSVINYKFQKATAFSDFLFEQEWVSQKYNAQNTSLSYTLNQLSFEFNNLINGHSQINAELFYAIAECIVKDQSTVFEGFSQLKSTKEETNGRLFNFIYDAKNYIEEHFLEKINLEQIALEAKLSQYHFIRSFKNVFGITPYQYVIKKRLEFAKILLLEGVNISDITYQTGFSNPANFSKAFKIQFNKSPKNFLK